jgi:hypothetical protein
MGLFALTRSVPDSGAPYAVLLLASVMIGGADALGGASPGAEKPSRDEISDA